MIGGLRSIAVIAALSAVAVVPQAVAEDIDLGAGISQGNFNTVVDELGVAAAYSSLSPAETLGITGVDLGLSISSYDIDGSAWDNAVADGDASSRLTMSRLSARKGLPFGVDIGAAYSRATSGDIAVFGGEVRKSLLGGTALTPAVSVTGHYSRMSGVDDIDLSAYGVDLGISKGFAIFTPYAGIGQVWYDGSEQDDSLTLSDRSTSQTRTFFGMRMGLLPFMSLTAQADFAEIDSYSLRLNLGF